MHLHRIHTRVGLALLGGGLLLFGAPLTRASFIIYVSSTGNNTVYAVPQNFGGAAVGAAQVFANGFAGGGNYGIASEGGDVYMAEISSGNVYRKSTTAPGSGPGTLFANTGVTTYDIGFADGDNLQVVGPQSTVKVISPSGSSLGTYSLGSGGFTAAGLDYATGDGVYLARSFGITGSIRRMTGSGISYTDATSAGLASVTFSGAFQQIVKDPNGFLYLSVYTGDNTIYRIDPATGAFANLFPGSTITVGANSYALEPVGLALGPDNELYFSNYAGPAGGMLFRVGLDGSGLAINPEVVATGLVNPVGIAFVVPEPSTVLLFGLGGWLLRRRRHA